MPDTASRPPGIVTMHTAITRFNTIVLLDHTSPTAFSSICPPHHFPRQLPPRPSPEAVVTWASADAISPPISPNHRGCCGSPESVSELVACMRNTQITKKQMSPRGQMESLFRSWFRPACHFPAPQDPRAESSLQYGQLGAGLFDLRESHQHCKEEPPMERVESGRDLRAKMYAKLSKENSLDGVDFSGPVLFRTWDGSLSWSSKCKESF